jgi:hypothetical protein
MAAHKMCPGFSDQQGEFLNYALFDAPDVSNYGPGPQKRNHSFRQRSHPRDGGTKNNEIRIVHCLAEVLRCTINSAHFGALFDAGSTTNIPDDKVSQSTLSQAQAQ